MNRFHKILLGVAVLIIAVGVIVFLFYSNGRSRTDSSSHKSVRLEVPQTSKALQKGDLLSRGKCTGEGPVTLTHSPMDLDDFNFIIPYGLTIGGHVTPIDHQYFSPADRSLGRDSYKVYAMADAKIVDIQHRINSPDTDEYRLVFMHSCTFFTYYDLVTSLSPDILAEYEKVQKNNFASVGIDVVAGQEIGKIGGQTLDFAVWNTEIELEGYIFADHYSGEPWRIHVSNPYDYYSEELNKQLMAKTIRTADPIGGKIDHDIEGTLQGVWFVKDSNWYTGNTQPYWSTHLSISPDHWDQTGYVFSIGDYDGEALQFGLARESVSPSTVNVASGVVKFELYKYGWNKQDGTHWDRESYVSSLAYTNYEPALGVALVQVLENNQLKVEVFPNMKASQVSGFTDNSTIYER